MHCLRKQLVVYSLLVLECGKSTNTQNNAFRLWRKKEQHGKPGFFFLMMSSLSRSFLIFSSLRSLFSLDSSIQLAPRNRLGRMGQHRLILHNSLWRSSFWHCKSLCFVRVIPWIPGMVLEIAVPQTSLELAAQSERENHRAPESISSSTLTYC